MVLVTVVSDPTQREYLFNAIETLPCVKRKADWALNWIGNKSATYGDAPAVSPHRCCLGGRRTDFFLSVLVQESAW